MLYATRHCVALQRLITLLSLFALYNIVLLVPSSAPHIKVILPPNSTSQEVTLFTSFMETEVTKNKNKSFFYYYLYAVIKTYICISILVFISVYSYFTLP